MKSFILATILLSSALNASAQSDPGWFTLHTPQGEYLVCWIDPATGPVTVHVVHLMGGAVGARFRLIPDPGLHWVYSSESTIWPAVTQSSGNVNDGIVVNGSGWGGSPGVTLMTVEYIALMPPDPCARLRIGAYPGSLAPTVELMALDGNWVTPTFVYDLYALPCSESPWCILTPVENSTWGAVKALYR